MKVLPEDAGLELNIVVVVVFVNGVETGGSNNVKVSIVVVPDERYKKSFFFFFSLVSLSSYTLCQILVKIVSYCFFLTEIVCSMYKHYYHQNFNMKMNGESKKKNEKR